MQAVAVIPGEDYYLFMRVLILVSIPVCALVLILAAGTARHYIGLANGQQNTRWLKRMVFGIMGVALLLWVTTSAHQAS